MVVVAHLNVTHLDVDVVLIIGLEKAFDMFALCAAQATGKGQWHRWKTAAQMLYIE